MYRPSSSSEKWAHSSAEAKEFESECLDSGFLSGVLDSAQVESSQTVEFSKRTLTPWSKGSLEPSYVDSGVIDVIPEDDDCLCSPVIDEKQFCSSSAAAEETSNDDCPTQNDLMELLSDAFAPDEDGETALHSAIIQASGHCVLNLAENRISAIHINDVVHKKEFY